MNTTTRTQTRTVTVADHEVRAFQRSVAVAGGKIVCSAPVGRTSYSVTYVI